MKGTMGNRPGFTQFTLTVETEAEALELWHRLNVSNGQSFDEYSNNKEAAGYPRPRHTGGYHFWCAVNECYQPPQLNPGEE